MAALSVCSAYMTVMRAQDATTYQVTVNQQEIKGVVGNIRELKNENVEMLNKLDSEMLRRREFEAKWQIVEQMAQRMERVERMQIEALQREVLTGRTP